jgi:hypothetical protein
MDAPEAARADAMQEQAELFVVRNTYRVHAMLRPASVAD